MHESVCMKPLLFVQQEIMIKERQLFSTFIVTRKNPFQISFADGIFALQPMFSYGQRSKCADLLNSYHIFFILMFFPFHKHKRNARRDEL